MKTLFINGSQIEFDRVIEFEQENTNLLECFFFRNEELILSKFLTLFEFNNIRKQKQL